MQQGDYTSVPYYPPYNQFQNPNPSPTPAANPSSDHHSQSSYASAPPFTSGYAPSDYSAYTQTYPTCAQNPDPVPAPPPPTAPSYTPTSNPGLQPFNSASQASSFPSFESHTPYQTPPQQQPYFPPYDQHQTAPSYAPPTASVPPNPSAAPNSQYSSVYSAAYGQSGASVPTIYDNPYENSVKYDQGSAYFEDRYGGYNNNNNNNNNQRSRSDLGADLYGKRYDSGRDDGYGDGVYAYQGNKVEPYGARGTAPKSSALFDDYGRSISFPSGKDSPVSSSKIVRAVPKEEVQQDAKSGVQKFRVKLLAESGGQSTMDVLFQIGLDGIQMLDPSASRTLRIYPLETITRCEVMDSSTLAFWSKSSVDIEPRRIRLQSNSYTTNTLLDIVTAATVQVKEMGGSTRPSDSFKTNEQPTDKRKGLVDWMNIMKPANEEKDHWVPDEAVSKCTACGTDFGAFVRKHHCRNCGDIFCDKCTHGRIALTADENAQPVRVCDRCMAEVTQRLNNAKVVASKSAGLQSHEDLAKKLQEEMERNRKSSSGSKSDASGRRMREVACPICTVHLQVQVPSSGSETIECGVCQNPFLVSAH
ncbi:Zinc finger, FYVE-type, endofin [Parasponia andersonii]|uniref:Zinc finger, FYVE-type, endofin n=1 Tax=Parasponia andersonii TaxID=3476 RepID=A0A2P5DJD3_PARAD|nr:Zinc finger, FYVE-type, endofin [Parasponia andersonii]